MVTTSRAVGMPALAGPHSSAVVWSLLERLFPEGEGTDQPSAAQPWAEIRQWAAQLEGALWDLTGSLVGRPRDQLFPAIMPEPMALGGGPAPAGPTEHPDDVPKVKDVGPDLAANTKRLRELFLAHYNSDLVVRPFAIADDPPLSAMAAYFDGLVEVTELHRGIIIPLMLTGGRAGLQQIKLHCLPAGQVEVRQSWADVVEAVTSGEVVVFVDGQPGFLAVDIKGFEHRPVGAPRNENVVRGPNQGFTENFRANTALVRRLIRSPLLSVELFRLGVYTRMDVALLHIRGLTNPKLVAEARRRLRTLQTSLVISSGPVEQLIEDSPWSPFPQVLATERPDRVAAWLEQGCVAILVGDDPYALVMPVTLATLLHSPEDRYLRWYYGSLARLLRALGLLMATLAPGVYIAVVMYHSAMIPTSLLLSIASARQAVPFSPLVELVVLDVGWQLIFEASVRVPSAIGPTIGIVGALILGQTAVAAALVSPMVVIIVAITAVASFTVPDYSLAYTTRVLRFAFEILGALAGLFGIALGTMALVAHLATVQSLGVPYLSPAAPFTSEGVDAIIRPQTWQLRRRARYLRPQNRQRQPRLVRGWLGGSR